jgi:hypothetical protein
MGSAEKRCRRRIMACAAPVGADQCQPVLSLFLALFRREAFGRYVTNLANGGGTKYPVGVPLGPWGATHHLRLPDDLCHRMRPYQTGPIRLLLHRRRPAMRPILVVLGRLRMAV